MNRLPPWQIWLPRLLFATVVILAVQLGLGLAVRSFVIRSGKASFGTHVDVRSSRVSLFSKQIVLNDLHIVDPHKPAEDYLDADRCELEVAARPLLHRQLVVTGGRLSGLRFSVLGKETGKLTNAKAAPALTTWLRDDADVLARQWFDHLAGRLKRDVSNQFESVRRTQTFGARWADQSAVIEARGQNLNQQAAQLQHDLDMAQNNPLRSGAFLVNLPNTIAELQKKFAAFNSELNQLPDELESERRAIVAARRRDERLSNKTIELEPIDGDEITAYLLRSQVVKQLDELIEVMRWVRDKIPEKRAIGLRGQRGEDVLFTGCREQPNFLVRAIELQGSARIANQPVELRGVLSNFTTLTALYDEPIQLRLEGHGAMPVELKATINRANGALRDELLVDCQSILLPALELGHSDQVAMTIAPSTASISIRAAVDGDKLVGEVQMVQQNVRIVPTVENAFGRVPIADALEESLGHIDSFATRISLGGTLAEPSCALWSNLGPAVTEAMEHAVRRGSSQHMRAMIVDAGKQVDEQLTGIERQMIEQQTQWQTRIVDVRARLQAIAAAEEPSDRLTPDRLGRRLPSNSLFR